jgi:hypothetical protein
VEDSVELVVGVLHVVVVVDVDAWDTAALEVDTAFVLAAFLPITAA